MANNRSFSLGDQLDAFVNAQVAAGRFGNATEVIRAGLRMLQDYEAKMAELRQMIDQADHSIAAGKGKHYRDASQARQSIIGKELPS